MKTKIAIALTGAATALTMLGGAAPAAGSELGSLQVVASVDERFQSYNVEMVEVTGGRFWAPYGGPADEVYRQRGPLDLTDPRLLGFAKALAPAYMRVSGAWSNNTYLPAEGETVSAPPAGFKQVLTRRQWRNVVAFSRAADAPIVTSFAVSTGTRGPDGVWQPVQAQRSADLTREAGGTLAAAEFFNEPNMPGAAQTLRTGGTMRVWTITAPALDSGSVRINGHAPALNAAGHLTGLTAAPASGRLRVPGQAIAFVAVPGAGNRACRTGQ